MSARVSLDPFQLSAHDLAMSSTFHSLDSNMFFTTGTLGYIAPCNSAAAIHWFSRPQLNAFYKRALYPGEFTWWLDGHPPAKRKKRNADTLRINATNYRQRVKIDNEAVTANAERQMLATAGER